MSIEQRRMGLVAYCDGGANPNPGPSGSGIHGYVYVYPEDKERPTSVGTKHVATNLGYVVKKDIRNDATPVKIIGYFEVVASHGPGTNNIGEIRAASIMMSMPICDKVDDILIISDSKLVVQGVNEWMHGWAARNWNKSSGEKVSNLEDWKVLHQAIETYKTKGRFTAKHVLGHNDDYGNVIADQLASLAVNYATTGWTGVQAREYTPEEYKAIEVEIHPFICLNRVYFSTMQMFNTPGLYYQTDGSDEKSIFGKRTGEAIYSVVKLDQPDKMLESVIEVACARPNETNAVAYTRMERLRKQDIQKMVTEHGRMCFTHARQNLNVNYLDKRPVAYEVREGELESRAINSLTHLEEILEDFIANPPVEGLIPGKPQYAIYDITPHFYMKKSKKSRMDEIEFLELKKEFGPGAKKTSISVNFSHFGQTKKVNLVFGLDLPSRNTLKQLEFMNPEIKIITWTESEKSVRYGVVVRSATATGIWSNYFANLLLFT